MENFLIKFILEIVGLPFLTFVVVVFSFSNLTTKSPLQKLNFVTKDKRTSFIRGIGMIGIVLIHIDSYFRYFHDDDFTKFTLLISNMSRFSVPIFIITSAIHLSWKGWKHFFLSRLLRILFPYLFFSLCGYYLKNNSGLDFLSSFSYLILTGSAFEPYYFIPILIQYYSLYLLLKNIKWNLYLRFTGLFFALAINLIINHFLEIPATLSRIFFGNFIFFFIFGLAFKDFLKNFNQNPFHSSRTLKFLNLSFLTVYTILIIFFTFSSNYQVINHYLYYPLAFTLLLYSASETLEKYFPKLFNHICKIGDQSLGIFLIHPIIIHFCHSFDPYLLGGKITGYLITLGLNIYLAFLIYNAFIYFTKKLKTAI